MLFSLKNTSFLCLAKWLEVLRFQNEMKPLQGAGEP